MDIHEILERAEQVRVSIEKLKTRIPRDGWDWYAYDSFGNFHWLDQLLTGPRRKLLELIGNDPVLDLGCGDGSVAFLLESLGCRVHAVDFAPTNQNSMLGVKALKDALGSTVDISSIDLDARFRLPEQRYGAAFFFGVLYHLKNPFYALETISRHARYCFLSTRIARRTPDRSLDYHGQPMAYLLAPQEANADATNYWIFSEAGLRRLLDRADWRVLDFLIVGNEDSDPASSEGDERAFCLAESKVLERLGSATLLAGWHDVEPGGWRWTQRRFSVAFNGLSRPPKALRLNFWLPAPLLKRTGPVTVRAWVEGIALPGETYAQTGEHSYVQALPHEAAAVETLSVEFELDKAIAAGELEKRELGLMALSVNVD